VNLPTRPAFTRDDIEWVLGPSGPSLQYKLDWSAAHARGIERDREDERKRWIWRHEREQGEN
jgi:hypothetical protein